MAIVENLKDVVRFVQSLDNIELTTKIIALQTDILRMQEENSSLKSEVSELHAKLKFSQTLDFNPPFYLAESDPYPYCPRCWESEGKAIHLSFPRESENWNTYRCPECKGLVEAPRK